MMLYTGVILSLVSATLPGYLRHHPLSCTSWPIRLLPCNVFSPPASFQKPSERRLNGPINSPSNSHCQRCLSLYVSSSRYFFADMSTNPMSFCFYISVVFLFCVWQFIVDSYLIPIQGLYLWYLVEIAWCVHGVTGRRGSSRTRPIIIRSAEEA
ncbi:hypothetical protein BDZ91DRAFT_754933 [Kalaharituber pfeilii]|nr:hypothetical protein BDZ91DRAFT_754933 [Kalaharituber pfeilii]